MHETVREPGSQPAVTDAMRHSLRSKVAHAAELLHSQGPISTFIHTNPLHSLGISDLRYWFGKPKPHTSLQTCRYRDLLRMANLAHCDNDLRTRGLSEAIPDRLSDQYTPWAMRIGHDLPAQFLEDYLQLATLRAVA